MKGKLVVAAVQGAIGGVLFAILGIEAGVTKKLWSMKDIVALLEEEEAKGDRTRGPYKKRG